MTKDLRLAVDIGGTFTDIVLEAGGERCTPQGADHAAARPRQAVIDGARADPGRGRPRASATSTSSCTARRLATNAIIERKGARTALIATEGFRDMLDIADESRFDQYDLYIDKPQPLVPRAPALHGAGAHRRRTARVRLAARRGGGARAGRRRSARAASRASPSRFMHTYANPGA